MSKHTPGPWEYAQDELRPWRYSIYHNGPLCYTGDTTAQDGDGEANARLIAAAPELLDALRNTVNVLSLAVENGAFGDALSDDADTVEEVQSVIDAASAAILKATGDE